MLNAQLQENNALKSTALKGLNPKKTQTKTLVLKKGTVNKALNAFIAFI